MGWKLESTVQKPGRPGSLEFHIMPEKEDTSKGTAKHADTWTFLCALPLLLPRLGQLPHCPIANIVGDSDNNGQQNPYTVVPILSSHQPCPFEHTHPKLDQKGWRMYTHEVFKIGKAWSTSEQILKSLSQGYA